MVNAKSWFWVAPLRASLPACRRRQRAGSLARATSPMRPQACRLVFALSFSALGGYPRSSMLICGLMVLALDPIQAASQIPSTAPATSSVTSVSDA